MMYLSQPRDLISSMSAGCSRGTLLLPREDAFSSSSSNRRIESIAHKPAHSNLIPPPARLQLYSSSSSATATANRNQPAALVNADPNRRAQSRFFRSQHFQTVWDSLDAGTADTRPPHPYTELIKLCILKSRDAKLTLNQLYHQLEDKFPFFADSNRGKGWKNTLRHNLSTQPYFVKLEREHGQLGKGHYWTYDPEMEKPTSLAQSSVVRLSWLWVPSFGGSARASLPRFDDRAARSYRTDPPYMARRRSSPATAAAAARHVDQHVPRVRSATISTIHKPQPTGEPWERRNSASSFWSARSLSDAESANGSDGGKASRLPPLPKLPAGKSWADYWLSHPISRH